MEEKILEILEENRGLPNANYHRAKEIDTLTRNYYMEFIEWKDSNVGKTTTSSYWLGNKKILALEYVYEYWKDNIKK